MLGIIGGSGLTQLSNLDVSHREVVRTPYGEPSGAITFGQICGKPAMFLARHGYGHTIPPHEVNYRANIWALKSVGVTRIISVSAVGSMKEAIRPGHVVVVDQFIDRTVGRARTFFEDGVVAHVAFADPICEQEPQAVDMQGLWQLVRQPVLLIRGAESDLLLPETAGLIRSCRAGLQPLMAMDEALF